MKFSIDEPESTWYHQIFIIVNKWNLVLMNLSQRGIIRFLLLLINEI